MLFNSCRRAGLQFALLLGVSLPGFAALPESVGRALKNLKLPEHSLGVLVMPADGGAPVLAHEADTPFNPASTMKLLTSVAALETLGPAFQWRTGLWTDGSIDGDTLRGNLYIKGGGDPVLTYEKVWLLLRKLKARGVRHISGDLVLDRRYFTLAPDANAGQFDEQPERAYNVAPDALLMNFKAVDFDIESTASSVTVRADPPLAGMNVSHRFKLVDAPCDRWRALWQRPEISERNGQLSVVLQGQFPRNCRNDRYLGLLEPAAFADRLTRSLWQELGGDIAGATRQGAVPAAASLLAEQLSPPLGEVMRDMNKLSNNLIARTLFLTLGAERPKPDADTATSAEQQLRAWLASRRLDWPELVVENGSGLSRKERISPRHLGELLRLSRQSVYGPELFASLPILGLDGTLQKRLTGSALAGQGHLKTGTLDDAKALAGVLRDAAGRDWIVVAIINHPRADLGQPVLDALLQWVWDRR
ncbi:D-alanyl-D-alanine carboxypeptidase/D-alanyl-D-alanine-endopeptidase [Chitinimonas sp.]|uniref:D-alanyl-D-alanine carboxypeptidase/D-alanyl-D-alanine endopeptidase n=1 Tax=Chitinimonas sp. TaxID=1934313 RepID=UPI0035B48BC3